MPADKFILLKIEGEFVDIMCGVNPKHKKNVHVENLVTVLYIRLLKAIYRYMESALLWCDIYLKTLKPQGFLINPYYICIANRTIEYKQRTIAWYVDDNKVSHVKKEVNTKVIEIKANFFVKLSVSRGNKHKFLGMDRDFLTDVKLSLFVNYYIEESIELFG